MGQNAMDIDVHGSDDGCGKKDCRGEGDISKQFANDMEALEWANTCVLVLPCGRSAHTEAGWCKGRGMKTIVYIPNMEEPELMYKLFDAVTDSIEGILAAIGRSSLRWR